MMDTFTFPGLTTRVVFGAGTLARVEEEVRRLGHSQGTGALDRTSED